jgi:LL-diaminopimelate aminotransferase
MGVGDPEKPTPTHILQVMHEAIADAFNYNYPPYEGTKEFRETAAKWMERWFGVTGLNPNTEVISSIGSKEGSNSQYFLSLVEAGDYTLIRDPGYPAYRTSIIFASGDTNSL